MAVISASFNGERTLMRTLCAVSGFLVVGGGGGVLLRGLIAAQHLKPPTSAAAEMELLLSGLGTKALRPCFDFLEGC